MTSRLDVRTQGCRALWTRVLVSWATDSQSDPLLLTSSKSLPNSMLGLENAGKEVKSQEVGTLKAI